MTDDLVLQREFRLAAIGDFKLVMASNRDFGHFDRDRVFAISGQSIDASAHEKMGAQFLRGAEKFINVIFPVADVHQAFGVA